MHLAQNGIPLVLTQSHLKAWFGREEAVDLQQSIFSYSRCFRTGAWRWPLCALSTFGGPVAGATFKKLQRKGGSVFRGSVPFFWYFSMETKPFWGSKSPKTRQSIPSGRRQLPFCICFTEFRSQAASSHGWSNLPGMTVSIDAAHSSDGHDLHSECSFCWLLATLVRTASCRCSRQEHRHDQHLA